LKTTIINKLRKEARESWPGKIGEDRELELVNFLEKKLTEYSKVLGFSESQILESMEKRRTYMCTNYYQEANFPNLKDVRVFETREDLTKLIPSRKFRCPSCGGVSTDPYKCNVGEDCDWKSYGLLGTLGKGLTFTIKDQFLEKGTIDNIFMPLEFEKEDQ